MAQADESEPKKRRSTSTSEFGVGKREGHDSTDFYARFAAPQVSDEDQVSDDESLRAIDQIFVGSATGNGAGWPTRFADSGGISHMSKVASMNSSRYIVDSYGNPRPLRISAYRPCVS